MIALTVPKQLSRRAASALAAAALTLGVVVGAAAAPGGPTTVHIQAGTPNDRVLVIADLPASSPSAAPLITLAPTPTPTIAPTPTPTAVLTAAPPALVIRTFPASGTAAQFLASLSDVSIDVLELSGGTYKWPSLNINVARPSRPLLVRATPGAQVIFSGAGRTGGQFYLGLGGKASDLDFEFAGVTFDGYSIGDTGIVWAGNVERITINDPTVQNVTSIGTGPINSWALYLSVDGGLSPRDFTADRWRVKGTARGWSALQIGHPPSTIANVKARGWTVSSVAIAIYAYGSVSGLVNDGWQISDSRRPDRAGTVFYGSAVTGSFSNMHSDLGNLEAQGAMTRGPGNVGI